MDTHPTPEVFADWSSKLPRAVTLYQQADGNVDERVEHVATVMGEPVAFVRHWTEVGGAR